jgi:hypothetical protein
MKRASQNSHGGRPNDQIIRLSRNKPTKGAPEGKEQSPISPFSGLCSDSAVEFDSTATIRHELPRVLRQPLNRQAEIGRPVKRLSINARRSAARANRRLKASG